jgi:hypothetical protein
MPDKRTSDRHKRNPVPFRPPEGDRSWLLTYAASTGQAVNAVLVAALGEYRARHGDTTSAVLPPAGGDTTTVAVPPVNGDTTSHGGDTTAERTPPRPELKPEPSPEPERKRSCTHKRMRIRKGVCPECGQWVSGSS